MATAIPLHRQPASVWSFQEVCRRLGLTGRAERYQLAYIDGLIAEFGFPRPLPVRSRGRFIESAHRKATWQAAAVEAWLLDRLPPDVAAAQARREADAAAERLDARAAAIFAPANDQVAA